MTLHITRRAKISARVISRVAGFGLFFLALLGCASHRAGRSAENAGTFDIALGWRATCDTANAPADQSVPSQVYWSRVGHQAAATFWQFSEGPSADADLRYYVDRFGTSGARADFAWMLAGAPELVPDYHIRRKFPDTDDGRLHETGLRRIQAVICKEEVTRFLQDPEMLQRFYAAVLWSGRFFGIGDAQWIHISYLLGELRKGFADDDYWQCARAFVLLAHATSRDDLFTNVTPTELKKQFVQWDEWLTGGNGAIFHLDADQTRLVWRLNPRKDFASDPPVLATPMRPFCESAVGQGFFFGEFADDYYTSPALAAVAWRAIGQLGRHVPASSAAR
jgi:hypothetical protein